MVHRRRNTKAMHSVSVVCMAVDASKNIKIMRIVWVLFHAFPPDYAFMISVYLITYLNAAPYAIRRQLSSL